MDNPSEFARTAFIEALQRAGVTVTSPATGANPTALLPPKGSYSAVRPDRRARLAALAQYVKLILKVSYNRGADLMTCLAAVKAGSTNCLTGLAAEVKTATSLGVPAAASSRRTARAQTIRAARRRWRWRRSFGDAARTSNGKTFVRALPVLGRDGTLADVCQLAGGRARPDQDRQPRGRDPGWPDHRARQQPGRIHQTKSGRRVVFMIAVGNVPVGSTQAFLKVVDDQARHGHCAPAGPLTQPRQRIGFRVNR